MPQNYLKAQVAPPSPVTDAAQVQARGGRYGEQFVLPVGAGLYGPCAEGTYFRATNPTINTAIAQAVNATWVATTPVMTIRNTDAAAGKVMYLDYIRLIMTVIPASATNWELAVITDPNNRYTSGGSLLTPVNANTAYSGVGISSIHFGAITAPAAVAPRILTRARVFNAIPVVGSQLILNFGASDAAAPQTMNGANAVNLAVPCGPVALGPGNNHTCLIYLWYASNATTPAQFEVEMGWLER